VLAGHDGGAQLINTWGTVVPRRALTGGDRVSKATRAALV